MTRIVPPIPGLTYVSIDDAGLVLSDPSGVIASWSIEKGVLTVTTNAVIGSAFLLRSIAPYPTAALLNCHVLVKRAGAQTATRVNVDWGVGGDPAVTVAEFIGVGLGIENDANVDRAHTSVVAANNWSNFIDQLTGSYGLISLGAPSGNNTDTQASATAGGKRIPADPPASAWHRADITSNVWEAQVEGLRINNEVGTAHTFSVEVGYRYEYISYEDGAITSGPPPASLLKLNPIGSLTLSAGWTLSDPSGIIATAPVSDGSTVTVGFNAIAGVAYLTRPLTNADTDAVLVATSMQRASIPVTMTGDWEYGIGTVDGALHSTSGMSTNPTGVASRIRRNGATVGNGAGGGHDGVIGSFMMPSTDAVSDGVARWTGLTTGIARSGASGNLNRANGPQFTEAGSRYEVIRMETNGLAAETMSWTFLSGIASFAYLPAFT